MTSVVILNYNGLELLKRYLPTVLENTSEAEIIVADNGSEDESVPWLKNNFPTVRLICLDKNYGFAEGYNSALKKVDSEYYVLMNSDVRVPYGWLAPLEKYMKEHSGCAACQPKILSDKNPEMFEYAGAAGGYIDIYGYPFCRGRVMEHVERDKGQYDTDAEVFWATGACLMIRSREYWNAGGLDSRFFAHQEEIDLCWRLKSRGWSIRCVPESKVYHVGGGSLDYESPFKTKLNFRNNALMLYKNLSSTMYWYVRPIRVVLDWIAALQMLIQRKPKNARAVLEAQKEFYSMKKDFKNDRTANLKMTTIKIPEGMMKKWLLWQVMVKKKQKFDELRNFI